MYGRRYEPDWLVKELRRNLRWVDELVEVDDRARSNELWVHEGEYRQMQRQALVDAGIRPHDVVGITSPDERWSDSASAVIPQLVRARRRVAYRFPLRELWTPTQFRVDGFWGRKWRPRLYEWMPGQRMAKGHIQTVPIPIAGLKGVNCRKVQIYHLESIEPESRVERAIVYKALDPNYQRQNPASLRWRRLDRENRYFRRYGYAYLADGRTVVLRNIREAEKFSPPYDPNRPFKFRVPDELLYKQCGHTRAELTQWLVDTLGYRPPGINR